MDMYNKSVGQQLKEAREQKDMTIEQVVEGTHISRRLIVALEEERFDEFVGETYLAGFLRNYANYLELNGDNLVQRYRSLQMQEQPAPMVELLEKKSVNKALLIVVIIVAVLLGGAVAGFFLRETLAERFTWLYRDRNNTNDVAENEVPPQTSVSVTLPADHYPLTERILERIFRVKSGISYSLDGTLFYVSVENIEDSVVLRAGDDTVELAPRQSSLLDLDADTIPDIRAEVKEILQGGNRAAIRFEVAGAVTPQESASTPAPAATPAQAPSPAAIPSPSPAAATIPATAATPAPAPAATPSSAAIPSPTATPAPALNPVVRTGTTTVASRRRSILDLGEVNASQPYTVAVAARAPTVIHYQQNGQERIEYLLESGDSINLEGGEEVRLWVANAGAIDFLINGNTIGLGAPGQVRVFAIRRTVIPLTNRANLQLVPFY